MKQKHLLDLYSDYLLASCGATTATGLSQLLEGEVRHDHVTRHLSGKKTTAAALWLPVKPFVRKVQSAEGGLIIDDASEEKPYTDENASGCWHSAHSKDALVKGLNFRTALSASQEVSLPVGFHLRAKTETYLDQKTQQENRRRAVSTHESCRGLIKQAVDTHRPVRVVVFEVWFASAETMRLIKHEQNRDFLCPLKTNRKVALSGEAKLTGRDARGGTLEVAAKATRTVYREGVDFPLLLATQVFTNEEGRTGLLDLVSSATPLSFDDLTTT